MVELWNLLLVFSLWILFKVFVSRIEPSDVLILRKNLRVVNGTPKTTYIVSVGEVKIPVNKINFVNSIYKEALLNDKIEDLNVIIKLGNKEIHLGKESLLLYSPPPPLFGKDEEQYLVLKLDYREIEADLQDVKEAKVLIRSGKVVIGETTIGVEIY